MSGGRSHEFCPHLSFRLSFRHKRISEKNQSSEENTSAVVINNSANIDLVEHETVHKSPEVHHEGSGEPADLPTDINKRVRTTSIEKVGSVSPRNDGICQECELAGIPSAPRSLYHLWRCLEPKCKLLLCGKQGHNHSQLHCQVCLKSLNLFIVKLIFKSCMVLFLRSILPTFYKKTLPVNAFGVTSVTMKYFPTTEIAEPHPQYGVLFTILKGSLPEDCSI